MAGNINVGRFVRVQFLVAELGFTGCVSYPSVA